MFCGRCGAQNPDGGSFCARCGAPLNVNANAGNGAAKPGSNYAPSGGGQYSVPGGMSDENYEQTYGHAPGKNKKKGIIAVLAAAVVIVIVLIIIIASVSGRRSYKKVVDNMWNAMFSADADALLDLMPDEVVDEMLAQEGYTRREFISELEEELDDEWELLQEYGGSISKLVDWEIIDEDSLSDYDYEELVSEYRYEYGIKISDALILEVEYSVLGYSDTMEIDVIKIGKKWYLDMESMGW